jgi:hypothetical protein
MVPMNEQQARVWVRNIIEVVKQGATLTDFTIDDQAAEMMLRAVDSDLLWASIWKLIGGLLNDEPDVVGCEMPVTDVAAINPLMVIAIVKAIVELWKSFRG